MVRPHREKTTHSRPHHCHDPDANRTLDRRVALALRPRHEPPRSCEMRLAWKGLALLSQEQGLGETPQVLGPNLPDGSDSRLCFCWCGTPRCSSHHYVQRPLLEPEAELETPISLD